MRRLICILTILFLLSPTARAGESYENAGDLWEAWNRDGAIPGYITGVWSSDGSTENLTFGLVPGEAGEAAKAEILAFIQDDSTVQFVTQTYSRNYLLSILEEVNTYFEKGLGFTSAGPNEYENRVEIELHMDYQENPESLAAVAELEEKYGDAVSIRFTDTVYELTTQTLEAVEAVPNLVMLPHEDPTSPLAMCILICMALGMVLLWDLLRRRRLALITGGTLPDQSLTLRQVEEKVRNTPPPVSRDLDKKMEETIQNLTK